MSGDALVTISRSLLTWAYDTTKGCRSFFLGLHVTIQNFLSSFKDEKRYFQMELLNRETNFNKVFKAAPNIGVINPLQAKTKPGKEGMRQTTSLVTSSSKLDPIPNMLLHEKRLNNSRPLPPTPPKDPPPHRKTTVY